jgi:hypothetical protein
MTTRLRSRVSAVEEKVACSGPNNAISLYLVKGYPTDGAEDLITGKRSRPVCFAQDYCLHLRRERRTCYEPARGCDG